MRERARARVAPSAGTWGGVGVGRPPWVGSSVSHPQSPGTTRAHPLSNVSLAPRCLPSVSLSFSASLWVGLCVSIQPLVQPPGFQILPRHCPLPIGRLPSLSIAPLNRADKDDRGRETPLGTLSWRGGRPTPLASGLGLPLPSCGKLALQSMRVGLGQQAHLRAEAPELEQMGLCPQHLEPCSHSLRGGTLARSAWSGVWASSKIRSHTRRYSREQGPTLSKISSNGAKVGENLQGWGMVPTPTPGWGGAGHFLEAASTSRPWHGTAVRAAVRAAWDGCRGPGG